MSPKISVIIPTYNRANLLPRTIKSVLNQTFKDFELIVVDDCSTDNTKDVVNEFQKKDERIKLIILDKNFGAPAHPKNIGIKNSKGEFIAFLDDDDEWLPEKLEKQLKLFIKDNNIGFVSCDSIIVNENTKKEVEYKTPHYKNVFEKLLENTFINSCSSVMIKKIVLDDIGFFDESLRIGEDWDMWLRIAQKYNFDFVDEPLFKYYVHSGNTTALTSFQHKIKDIDNIFDKHKQYYYKHPKIYSSKLRYDGTRCILNKELKEGRKYFLRSIKLNPLNLKSYFYFILSLSGVNFYHNLTLIKARLKNLKIFKWI